MANTYVQQYEGNAFFNFIESCNSEITKRNYAYCLKQFLRFHGLTNPQELLSIGYDTLEDMIKKYLVNEVKINHSPSQAKTP